MSRLRLQKGTNLWPRKNWQGKLWNDWMNSKRTELTTKMSSEGTSEPSTRSTPKKANTLSRLRRPKEYCRTSKLIRRRFDICDRSLTKPTSGVRARSSRRQRSLWSLNKCTATQSSLVWKRRGSNMKLSKDTKMLCWYGVGTTSRPYQWLEGGRLLL